MQHQVAPVQEAFCSLGSKDPLHPLLTTFGDFPVFDPSPRHSALQAECRKVVANEVDAKFVAKLSRSSPESSQSCYTVVTGFVAKSAAKLSQSLSQHLHKFMSHCCQNPLGENPFSVLLMSRDYPGTVSGLSQALS